MQRILVSACLLGERVRYDGRDAAPATDVLARWVREGRVVSICPEVAGGLPVPRPAAEIQGGSGVDVLAGKATVARKDGSDVSAQFLSGAQAALDVAQANGVRMAILKARSPSCGKGEIHDGTFSKVRKPGDGVTAALLAQHGIAVFTDEELERAAEHLATLETI
ncbi:MAG: DUF523 domain-containing protein [Deltaproteobacteria bacterium]|nr:DUF523 domain-containing protein [Deltaproteobacteria bacterium]